MNNLIKLLIFSSPILAIVFYYVIAMQNKHDVDIKHDDAAFERTWNEAEAALARSEELKAMYLVRAKEAETRLKKHEAEKAEREAKAKKFQNDFEKEMNDFDKKGVKND